MPNVTVSRSGWPATLIFAAVGLSAAALLALFFEHVRPHPDDMKRLSARLTSMDLHVRSIERTRAIWHLHYRKRAWHLSRFARFYRIDAETDEGEPRRLYAAFDPWRANYGMQIL